MHRASPTATGVRKPALCSATTTLDPCENVVDAGQRYGLFSRRNPKSNGASLQGGLCDTALTALDEAVVGRSKLALA